MTITPISELSPRDAFKKVVKEANIAEITRLLEAGISVNMIHDTDLNTTLHIAVKTYNQALIALSIKHHAFLNQKNRFNQTPLEMAVQLNAWDAVLTILKNNLFKENYKESCLFGLKNAIYAAQIDVVEQLLGSIDFYQNYLCTRQNFN